MIARPIPFCLLLALAGCGKWADSLFCSSAGCDWKPGEWERIAALANPGDPPPDLSNEWRDSGTAIALGKEFFFDGAFSGNATQKDAITRDSPPARAPKGQAIGIACVTCHDLEHGGGDVLSSPGHVSVGAGWTDVNALSVVNSAYRQVVFWNGRADSLWALNAVVAESATTLNGNRLNLAHVIATRYAPQYELAFLSGSLDVAGIAALPANGKPGSDPNTCNPAADPPEPFADAYDCLTSGQKKMVTQVLVNWAKAIAAYEYKLLSVDSPFDRFVAEGQGSTRISAAAQRGARLFVGKAACVDCHSGPQLTDELFHDIGIPQVGLAVPTTTDCPKGNAACDCSEGTRGPCAPWGAWDGLTKLARSKWLRTGDWSGDKTDLSRDAYAHLALTDALKGAWRTPSLRNVALTAPYMHDGRYATLQEVIWHYNSGGQTAGPEQVGDLAPQIRPLMLTDSEQADLVAFLESLTGAPVPDQWTRQPVLPGPTGGGGAGGATGSTGAAGSGVGPSGTAGVGGRGVGGSGTGPVGGSMATGSGGGGGSGLRQLLCTGAAPPIPLITDFEDAVPGPMPMSPASFGTPPRLTGRVFLRVSSASVPPPTVRLAPGIGGLTGLNITRPSHSSATAASDFYEFGLMFDDCVDARAFQAIQFSAMSIVPVCDVKFGVISRPSVSGAEDPRGACTMASCDAPLTSVPLSGVVRVPFSAVASPFVDPASIIGLRWRVSDGCGVSALIDDILFVNP